MIGISKAVGECTKYILEGKEQESANTFKEIKALTEASDLVKDIMTTHKIFESNERLNNEVAAISFIKNHFNGYGKYTQEDLDEVKKIFENFNQTNKFTYKPKEKSELIESLVVDMIEKKNGTVPFYNKMDKLSSYLVAESKKVTLDNKFKRGLERDIAKATINEKQAFEVIVNGDTEDQKEYIEELKEEVVNKIDSVKTSTINENDTDASQKYDLLKEEVQKVQFNEETLIEDVQELINLLDSQWA